MNDSKGNDSNGKDLKGKDSRKDFEDSSILATISTFVILNAATFIMGCY